MKTGGPDHPKTEGLAQALACGLAQAIGHLELTWHFTSEYCPSGAIGRYTDALIAKRAGWEDDPAEFIGAMTDCGWLDRDSRHRLVVHGWPEHCPDYVHVKLARAAEHFADGRRPKMARLARAERELLEAAFAEKAAADPKPLENRGDCEPVDIEQGTGAQEAHKERTPSALPILTYPKQESAPDRRADPADPLEGFPELQTAYADLQVALADSLRLVAPKASAPARGSKADMEARDALARLVRLDGYHERDLIDTLHWLFTADSEDAAFWRQQVRSLASLRKTKDGLSKFAKVHAARLKAEGSGRMKTETPLDPELIALFGGNPDA